MNFAGAYNEAEDIAVCASNGASRLLKMNRM